MPQDPSIHFCVSNQLRHSTMMSFGLFLTVNLYKIRHPGRGLDPHKSHSNRFPFASVSQWRSARWDFGRQGTGRPPFEISKLKTRPQSIWLILVGGENEHDTGTSLHMPSFNVYRIFTSHRSTPPFILFNATTSIDVDRFRLFAHMRWR